jgi:PTS system trehalose-specific IIC component
MASTSAISAYFGITEPAMFGVNLRYKFPFYAAARFGAGQHFPVAEQGPGLGHRRRRLAGFISIIPQYIPMFVIGMVVAMVVPFVLTCG